MLATMPRSAEAQFGSLKKLKKAIASPDSAQLVADSIARVAAGPLHDSTAGRTKMPSNIAAMPDAQLMIAFQQELVKVTTAAGSGDVAAQKRLDAWEALTVKYEAEAERLSSAAGKGDMTALAKLEAMQIDIIREFMKTSSYHPIK